MPTYDYECKKCGLRFERLQSISEDPLVSCPECDGQVHRLISGGIGFIVGSGKNRLRERTEHSCSLEKTGKTCCGRDTRCNTPDCEDK
jgi:putative FmdB family regulatory protein